MLKKIHKYCQNMSALLVAAVLVLPYPAVGESGLKAPAVQSPVESVSSGLIVVKSGPINPAVTVTVHDSAPVVAALGSGSCNMPQVNSLALPQQGTIINLNQIPGCLTLDSSVVPQPQFAVRVTDAPVASAAAVVKVLKALVEAVKAYPHAPATSIPGVVAVTVFLAAAAYSFSRLLYRMSVAERRAEWMPQLSLELLQVYRC